MNEPGSMQQTIRVVFMLHDYLKIKSDITIFDWII